MTVAAFDLYLSTGAVVATRRRKPALPRWFLLLDMAATALGVTAAGLVIAIGFFW